MSDNLLIALITFCLSDSFFKSISLKVESLSCKNSVKADYTITMTYRNGNEANDREVKFKGSWYGIINTTSKAKPDEIVTIPLEEYMKSLSNNNLQ